ncbi:MAG TPA: maleylpyruvate isomerase N-terminal domain-containing protein [Actinocrinis sp.]|nr:maleylpyruvate isomerase N-terminal domain-containing protein [Actinocrinis sp.]
MTEHYRLGESADPAGLLDRAIAFTLGAVHAVTPERLSAPTPCEQWDLRALLIHVADSLEALGDGLGTGRMDLVPAAPAAPTGQAAPTRPSGPAVPASPATQAGPTGQASPTWPTGAASPTGRPGPAAPARPPSSAYQARHPGPAPVSDPVATQAPAVPTPPPLSPVHAPTTAPPRAANFAAPPLAIDDPVACLRAQAARLLGVGAAGAGRGPVRIADSALDPRIVLGIGAVEIAVHGWDICRACGVRRPIPPALAVELAGVCALVVTADTRYPAFAAPVAVPNRSCPSDHLVAFLGRDPTTMSDPF